MSDAAIHASCVVVGEAGILILGPSGSGKSTLARALVGIAGARGGFAALVGDDRIVLARRHGVLVARCHPAILGLVEVRGLGLVRVPAEPACAVRLIVECGADPPRLPADRETKLTVHGVILPRIAVAHGNPDAAYTVLWKLRDLDDTTMSVPGP